MDNIKSIQKIELDILKEIVNVCENHSIEYWIAAGTMLGAVRHHGFIPWDDDIDLYMRFDDLIRFENIAMNELPENYIVDSQRINPQNGRLFVKVFKYGTEVKYSAGGKQHNSDLWVDIFPLLDLADDKRNERRIVNKLRNIQEKYQLHPKITEKDRGVRRLVKKIINSYLVHYEEVCWKKIARHGEKGNRYICLGTLFYKDIPYDQISKIMFPKSLFNGYALYSFENLQCRGVKEYDYYLTQRYGNWRVPVKNGGHMLE